MIRVNGEGGLLFIDQGGFDTELNRVATSGADLLLTATNDSFFELNGFVEFAKILKEINEDIRNQHGYELVANVIPCKIHPSVRNIEHIKDFVDKTPGFAMMNSVIKSFKNYGLAPGAGQSVVEYAEYDSSSINFLEFKKEVDNIIK
jgi:chromosome partitioning protein